MSGKIESTAESGENLGIFFFLLRQDGKTFEFRFQDKRKVAMM